MAQRLGGGCRCLTLASEGRRLRRRRGLAATAAHRDVERITPDMGKFGLQEGASILRAYSRSREGGVELSVRIHLEPTHMKRMRGRAFLPHAVGGDDDDDDGKVIVVLAQGVAAQAAKDAGATHVGTTDVLKRVLDGEIVPSRLIAATDTVDLVRRDRTAAKFLGPKGLMPSEKRGTVVDASSMAAAIADARGGLEWAAEPLAEGAPGADVKQPGSIEAKVARIGHLPTEVVANITALLKDVASVAESTAPRDELKGDARPSSLFRSLHIANEPGQVAVDLDMPLVLAELTRAIPIGPSAETAGRATPTAVNRLFPKKLTPEDAWKRLLDVRRAEMKKMYNLR